MDSLESSSKVLMTNPGVFGTVRTEEMSHQGGIKVE